MAKYDVSHTCGHTETVQLFGKHAERDRKIAWMEGKDCPECAAAALRAANEAKAKEIRESGLNSHWPKLAGSERQITWAETIRARLLPACEETVVEQEARAEERGEPDDDAELARERQRLTTLGLALDHVRSRASAQYWIDHRDSSARSLLRDAVDEMAESEREKVAKDDALAKRKALEAKVAALCDRWCAIWARPRDGEFDYTVQLWKRNDDHRVYITTTNARFGDNVVEYFHTGTGRYKSGTLCVKDEALADAVERRGVPADQIRDEIKAFCAEVAGWNAIKIDSTKAGW